MGFCKDCEYFEPQLWDEDDLMDYSYCKISYRWGDDIPSEANPYFPWCKRFVARTEFQYTSRDEKLISWDTANGQWRAKLEGPEWETEMRQMMPDEENPLLTMDWKHQLRAIVAKKAGEEYP